MSKFILILLISSFLCLGVDAQDTVSAKMEVRYLVSYVTDTVKNIVLEDTFCLRFNEEKSLFYESDTFMKDSLRYNDIAKWSDMMSKILTISYPKIREKQITMCLPIMCRGHISIKIELLEVHIVILIAFLL